jgi:hypothetical protein
LADDPNGASCSTVECIVNIVDTATCDNHPSRIGPSVCEAAPASGGMLVQTIHTSPCPGGTVAWMLRQIVITDDCGSECEADLITWTCGTDVCAGPLVRGPYNRGTRRVCGCP